MMMTSPLNNVTSQRQIHHLLFRDLQRHRVLEELVHAPQQPTIILDPPAGVISTHTQIFPLAATLATGFPKARSMLFTQDSVSGVTCDNEDTNTDLTGLVTTSCSYQVRLLTQETRLSLVVLQEGFKNKTFQYRVTTTAFPDNTGGQNTMQSSCFIFIIFCYYIIINQ